MSDRRAHSLKLALNRESDWIDFVRDLGVLIRRVKPDSTVRIAIIDDGIQLGPSIKVVDGKSFWRSDSDDDFKDFWVAPGGHGTDMATYITTACPMANLVIARVADEIGADNMVHPRPDTLAKVNT